MPKLLFFPNCFLFTEVFGFWLFFGFCLFSGVFFFCFVLSFFEYFDSVNLNLKSSVNICHYSRPGLYPWQQSPTELGSNLITIHGDLDYNLRVIILYQWVSPAHIQQSGTMVVVESTLLSSPSLLTSFL